LPFATAHGQPPAGAAPVGAPVGAPDIGYATAPPVEEADVANGFDVFVADQLTYDSNLYRLPSYITDVTALVGRNASRADHINTASLGADGRWSLGRQRFDADVRVDDNWFSGNSSLNNKSGTGKFLWTWRVGSLLSGQLGGDYTRSLAGFAYTGFLGRDVVDSWEYFGTARYQLGPHWAAFGGINEADSSHGASLERVNDLRTKSGNAGVEYATNVNDSFALEYRYTDGSYPQNYIVLNAASFDRDYRDESTRFLVKYALTEKTSLNASAGYLKRDYRNATSIGAFSGDIWRLSVQWQPSEKTQLNFAAWHDLAAFLYAQSDYFVQKAERISAVWVATEKLTFSTALTISDQDYIGSSLSSLTLGSRHDRVTSEQTSIVYTPRRALSINVSYRYEQRTSNQPQYKYNDNLVTAGLTYQFIW
jgi:exopolysaccharide biosynthesis operon protein EpsL